MEIAVLNHDKQVWTEYVFNVLFSTMGLPYRIYRNLEKRGNLRLAILYGCEGKARTLAEEGISCIVIHRYNGAHEEIPALADKISFLQGATKSNEGCMIPVLLESTEEPAAGEVLYCWADTCKSAITIRRIGSAYFVDVGFDLPVSTYLMIGREEEVFSRASDRYGRFSAKHAILWRKGLLAEPIVNQYIKLLMELIIEVLRREGLPLLQKWYWPYRKEFALCLTHDIDVVKKWSLGKIKDEFHNLWRMKENPGTSGAFSKSVRTVCSIVEGENSYWNFRSIMDMEEAYGFRSSFYFSTQKDVPHGLEYDIEDKRLIGVMKELSERGWEVGLHGGFDAFNDIGKLRREKEKLEGLIEEEVTGIRQHYLLFKVPLTWNVQQTAGFSYDCTFGYADCEGFRAGIAFPFYPYDPIGHRKLDILEIPLTVMDGTLGKYRGLSAPEADKVLLNIFRKIKKTNGLGCLLWHNKYFDDMDFPGYGGVFEHLLQWSKDQNAFGGSGEQINRWWRGRDLVRQVGSAYTDSRVEWVYENSGGPLEGLTFKVYCPDEARRASVEVSPPLDADIGGADTPENVIIIQIPYIEEGQCFKISWRK